ncbi:MAG: HEAT repeat domain-containing protein [Bdellovibrionales bacterium]
MSLIAFNEYVLSFLWAAAGLFAVVSAGMLALLFFRRKMQENEIEKTENRKEYIKKCFYAVMAAKIPLKKEGLPRLDKEDKPIVLGIALDLLRSIRGDDILKAIALMEQWDMVAYLENMATNEAKNKRIQAITLLSYFGSSRSLPVIKTQISSKDIYVHLAALRSYSSIIGPNNIDEIVNDLIAASQTNTLILADVLYRFGEPAIPSLIKLIKHAQKREVRNAAALALGGIGSVEAVHPLLPFVDDPDSEIRAQAISVLGKLGTEETGRLISKCLDDEDPAVRIQTAMALGKMAYVPALDALVKRAASDDDWWVRFRATEAISKMGNAGLSVLNAISRSDSPAAMLAGQVISEREWLS